MKQIKFGSLIIYFFLFSLILACSDDEIPNETELITSVYLVLVDTLQQDSVIISFKDLDGSGGLPPVYSTPPLKSSTFYLGKVIVLNESVNPPMDISEEIESEDEDHQFFYLPSNTAAMDIQYLDSDSNGNPLGSKISVQTKQPGSTKLKVILRHEPDKTATGVAQGDPTNAGGETDIEIEFDLQIQ
ncbi:MAG: type 1 periplasmic binding fold superfamily protein [Saprospiraceae bacterium]|nr:type 1 periplasmic binding fold superfamily protein [Saprospiraceae bacterium]